MSIWKKCRIIGEHATDLIYGAVIVMKMKGAVGDLYEAIKSHPTLSETLMEATLYKMEALESIGATWHHTYLLPDNRVCSSDIAGFLVPVD